MSERIQEWEYKVDTWNPYARGTKEQVLDERLNKLGKEGWELVGVKWWEKELGVGVSATAVFKRPKA